ncbi:glycosyltransferase family 4 protein [Actinomycetospora cinnamomea]|uniref:Glycosyltransferase involved in cell wall biosynthesis n=1 Tax=Actinomycetospora cinnamomea TaxID=663609 RepID=A0A2U1F740_9PSEU|nr:glycosyltransferase family 4 protein [Actinomycetospora cinnamomea]PVZ07996.1 glycosyltransferase involved in cell wall biosynthesis [Actinomycetospora cinnamomea]
MLWVSTSLATQGGISAAVRTLAGTPLWARWHVHHVASHQDGSGPAKVRRFALCLARVLAELLLRRPDLVHLHTSSDGSFVRKATILWLAKAARVPVVLHVHSGRFHDFHRTAPAPLRALIRRSLIGADAVVALDELWVRRLGEIAPGARFAIVPNAVPVPPAPPDRPDRPPHVVFLGRIWEKKGAFTLVESWAKALSEVRGTTGDGAHLTMAGDGDPERARALAAALGVDGAVTVHDWLPKAEVDALLDAADVLVLPSLGEGQPMVVLEAMARGLAVVATDVGGIPGLVTDGREGLLVPPSDGARLTEALVAVLADPARRRAMGAAAHHRAATEFDVDVVSRRVEDLYADLLTPGRRGRAELS